MKKELLLASVPFLSVIAVATAITAMHPQGWALATSLTILILLSFGAVTLFNRTIHRTLNDIINANVDLEEKIRLHREEISASESRLVRVHSFLDSIVENIPDMIFVKDAKDLRFVLFNKAGENLLGYPRETMIGKNDYDFFPKTEADFFTAKDRQVLTRGEIVVIEEEPIHTKSGPRILHTKKIPLFDANGAPQYLLGISEDVTARKESEKALTQRTQELAQAQIEKKQTELFTDVAAHDLREPLQKIRSFGDLLTEYLPAEGPARDYLARMQSASDRMSRLIEDLLRFSRITRIEMRAENIELDAVVRGVLEDFDLIINEAGARVDVGNLPSVYGGRIELQEVFRNLIGNALKFRSPGRAPEIRISAAVRPDGRQIVSVSDNGIGFDQALAERIFRPFERLHARHEYGGSGIGLAICEKLVDHMGATIAANSSPGEGTTFTIVFPPSGARRREPAASGVEMNA